MHEENRGFSVPPASLEELEELIRTRCWLEEIALRESIANGDEEWEERVVLAFHWLKQGDERRKSKQIDDSEWAKYHREFHQTLLSACNSGLLLKFCDQLQARTYRYRNLAEVVEYRDRNELAEHTTLYQAVLKRNADEAVALLHEHFSVTLTILSKLGQFE